MSLDQLIHLIGMILLGLSSFLCLILSITYGKHKKTKTKQDILLLERFFMIIFFNLSYIICSLLAFFSIGILSQVKQVIFIIAAVYYYSNILCCYIEQYNRICNPFYFFFSIFNQKKSSILWEMGSLISIAQSIAFLLVPIIPSSYERLYLNEAKDSFLLLTINIGVIGILVLLAFISLFVIIRSMSQLSPFSNPSKQSIKRKYVIDLLRLIILLLFALCNCAFWVYMYLYPDVTISPHYLLFFSYYFIGMLLLDGIIEMHVISSSEFFFYKIGIKPIGCFYSCCRMRKHYKPPLFANEQSLEPKKEHVLYYFQHSLEVDITQFFLEAAEYFLNTSLASISIIYDSILSGKVVEYSKEVDESDPKLNALLWQIQDKYHYHIFNFNKRSFQEEKNNTLTNVASNLLEKKGNSTYCNNVNIEVKSFYPKELKQIMEAHKVDIASIKTSLLSHASKFPFLICRNFKEEYFKMLKTLSLKTIDKTLNIDIFEDVLKEKGTNDFMEKYLKHILSNQSTFLPVIIGIFKIKINNSSPFFVFISRNSILENIPKEMYFYWQLMRYSGVGQVEIVSSSKERTSMCVTDDEILNGIQIQVLNYSSMHKTLKEDMALVRRLGLKNFSLLVMYYEFEANQRSVTQERLTENQSGSVCRVSDIKHILYQEDLSSLTDINSNFDLSKNKANGFDAGVNGKKSLLFFCFDGVLEFKGMSFGKTDYNSFFNGFMSNFEELKFELI